MIDSHCHLYLDEFKNDIEFIMQRAIDAGVSGFYLPAIDNSTHALMLELEKKFPACKAMMGLHPCSVKENCEGELKVIKKYLYEYPFAAIGEIGLDFYWDKTFTDQQYNAFHQQIELALQYRLPVVIHSRNATQDCIDVVKQYTDKGLKGIFHCFGGTKAEALQIIDCNFLLGIGGVITYKNSGLADVIAEIELQHLVLETDAPYLTPVPFRGKRNESSYLTYIAQKIADVKNISLAEVDEQTTANAIAIFKK